MSRARCHKKTCYIYTKVLVSQHHQSNQESKNLWLELLRHFCQSLSMHGKTQVAGHMPNTATEPEQQSITCKSKLSFSRGSISQSKNIPLSHTISCFTGSLLESTAPLSYHVSILIAGGLNKMKKDQSHFIMFVRFWVFFCTTHCTHA